MTNRLISNKIQDRNAHIVFIIRALVPYWEEAMDALALAWKDRGDVIVISGGSGEDELHTWDKAQGNMKHAVLESIPAHPRNLLGTSWPTEKIWEKLNEINPLVVLIHEYSPYSVLSGLIWAKANNKCVIVLSDVGKEQLKQLTIPQKVVHDIVNNSVDGILGRTMDAMELGLKNGKISFLAPHAIKILNYDQKSDQKRELPRKIIQVGSFIERKGVDLLIQAFAKALIKRPDLELTIVGAGDKTEARTLIKQLNLEKCVQLKEFMQPEELVVEYSYYDLFVLASRFDSYGVVVHEAAAASLPLVISKFVGAGSVLVEEGVNGFLIDPNNEESFSNALLEALTPHNNIEFRKKSLEIAEKNDVQHVANRTANWLKYLIKVEKDIKIGKKTKRYGFFKMIKDSLKSKITYHLSQINVNNVFKHTDDIVFLNRYAPFYREGIFKKISERLRCRVVHSGKQMGSVKIASIKNSTAIPSFSLSVKGGKKIIWLSTTLFLVKHRPKVVITELSLSLISTWWLFVLSKIHGFKIIFWTHGLIDYGWNNKTLTYGDKIRLKWIDWADAILFYDSKRKAELIEITGESNKYFVSTNMIDLSSFVNSWSTYSNNSNNHTEVSAVGTMIYIGRLIREKEVIGLIDILEETNSCTLPPNLLVIGDGELMEELVKRTKKFGDRVIFLGGVYDNRTIADYLLKATVMVSPGYLGLNIVQSLSMGCPIVSVDDRSIQKRHSPEISYLKMKKNAILLKNLKEMALFLKKFFDHEQINLTFWSREKIRDDFMLTNNLENQANGMEQACKYALNK